MKIHLRKLSVLTILLSIAFVCSTYAQDVKSYTVAKIDTQLVIDGVLDEDVWINADTTSYFVILGNDTDPPKAPTWAKMLWDDDYLYVGFYVEDSRIRAEYLDRDDPLYKEDVVEVYIDPDGDGENYLEIEINPVNTIFDLWLTKPKKEGGTADVPWSMEGLLSATTYKGTINDNTDIDTVWICEMALPFAAMEFSSETASFPPSADDIWRLNLYRFDRDVNRDVENVGEATGWSQTSGGQHEPNRFGEIVFAKLADPELTIIQSEYNADRNFSLDQNIPNPLSTSTRINYQITGDELVSLKVYDYQGREVAVLVNEFKTAGAYHSVFEPGRLPDGLYFYMLKAGSSCISKKMLIAD